MKISKKKIIEGIEIIAILLFLLIYYFNGSNYTGKNWMIIFSFLINGLIIVLNIVNSGKSYSLNKTFWYFNFFFFFIAPLLQYLTGYISWSYYISKELYLKTNFIILVCLILYSFCTYILFKGSKRKKINSDTFFLKNSLIVYSKRILRVLLLFSVLAAIFLVKKIGFSGLFIRGLNQIDFGDSAINSIVINTCRAIPVYSLIYSIYYYLKTNKGIAYILFEALIVFIINYPTSVTRYWVGLVYIGIFLTLIGNKLSGRKFDLFLILVFAVLFPIFQIFKWYSISDIMMGKIDVMKRFMMAYNSPDFDAYSIFVRTVDLVSKRGVEYGNQVLGSLLFIVPRSIWSAKPYPTGQFIAIATNQSFTNISCPMYAEGYIDFGAVGSVLYTFFICLLLNTLDQIFWNDQDEITYVTYMYPFLFGILIFLLRGSLLPVVVYSFTFFVFGFIIKILCFNHNSN